MKYLILFVCILLASACVSTKQVGARTDDGGFDREAALESYKDACSLDLVLAMGLSAQKEEGKTESDLASVAASSKSPGKMKRMVSELFVTPELEGITYTFFKYDSCLISKALSTDPVDIELVRADLVRCESTQQSMDGLIECIDRAIIDAQS